jgi:peptide-methionine (R)-S-oxide reductase
MVGQVLSQARDEKEARMGNPEETEGKKMRAGSAGSAGDRAPTTDTTGGAALSALAHEVLRCGGTERAFTSPLNGEKRPGTFVCAACGQALFESTAKYESGSGWPSFYAPLPGAVAFEHDDAFGMGRVEYHCSRCGGHHGHVFDDGPQPTGQRYCSNGVALRFIPA